MGACRQQEGSLSRTIEGNGGTGKRPSGSTVSTDGLVRSCVIHGKKALSRLWPRRGWRVLPGGTRASVAMCHWGVWRCLGGSLSPLCLPVSHADLSHALASSERERLWSGPSGRRALPELAGPGAHPLGGAPAPLLPPLSARDTPAQPGTSQPSASARPPREPPGSVPARARLRIRLRERWRGWGWGTTGCGLLELRGERGVEQRGADTSGSIPRSHPSRQLNPPPFPSCCLLSPSLPSLHR